jgi:hypothetical protein
MSENAQPIRPVLSPVDYAAWNRGYMPPAEHILIDQLHFRGAKIALASDWGDEYAMWLVYRGTNPRELKPHARKAILEMLALAFKDNEPTDQTKG